MSLQRSVESCQWIHHPLMVTRMTSAKSRKIDHKKKRKWTHLIYCISIDWFCFIEMMNVYKTVASFRGNIINVIPSRSFMISTVPTWIYSFLQICPNSTNNPTFKCICGRRWNQSLERYITSASFLWTGKYFKIFITSSKLRIELKLKIKCGYCSETVPRSGISCLRTTLWSVKYAVGPYGKWDHSIYLLKTLKEY
jgi:hypothetical protein